MPWEMSISDQDQPPHGFWHPTVCQDLPAEYVWYSAVRNNLELMGGICFIYVSKSIIFSLNSCDCLSYAWIFSVLAQLMKV